MYQNLEIQNIPTTENIIVDGEIMLMKTYEYLPSALSAVAKIMKRAGHFVCQFEVSSKAELFMVEASASDSSQCFRIVERKMREKINHWNRRARAHFRVNPPLHAF